MSVSARLPLRRPGSLWRAPELGVAGVLLFEVALFTFLVRWSSPDGGWAFIEPKNLLNILEQSAIFGIAAVGVAVVIIAGGIDLSVGGLMALTCVVSAGLLRAGWPLPAAIIATLGVGLASGGLAAFLVTVVELPPFIATLALMMLTRGVAVVMTQGEPWNIDNVAFIDGFGGGRILGIPNLALLLFAITALIALLAGGSAWGRQVFAVGGNETAARYAGVAVGRIKWSVYLLSGMLAAVTGIVYCAKYGTGSSGAANGYELDAVAAAVVGGASLAGGRGSIVGAMLGAVIFATLRTGLSQVNGASSYENVIVGCVVVLAVVSDRFIQRRLARR